MVVAGSVWKDDREGYEQLIDELNIREKIKWDIRYIPDDEVKFSILQQMYVFCHTQMYIRVE